LIREIRFDMPASRRKNTDLKSLPKKLTSKQRNASRLIVVRDSSIHGKGVFAVRSIPSGTRIIEYRGRRISEEAADAKYGDDDSPHTFLFLLNNDMVIDANHGGNAARWINHSCSPNCEPVEEDDRVFIEAIRDIKPEEELAYDYQLVVAERHTSAIKRFYACYCGARKCRGNFLAEKS
jgi:hypothetical protein